MSDDKREPMFNKDIWIEMAETLVKQGPTVVLLAAIAFVFWNKAEESNKFVIDLLLQERTEMRDVIKDNTRAMEENIKIIQKVTETINYHHRDDPRKK